MAAAVFVPRDTTACALGADRVADALAAMLPDTPVLRSGSRGAMWMEPLVEIDHAGCRLGFANVTTADLPSLCEAIRRGQPDSHPRCIGEVESHPWFAAQCRLTFARAGRIVPTDVAVYQAASGLSGLRRALAMSGQQIIDEVTASGLRGRGGAAFPAGIKWQTVRDAAGERKYIVCNADEGDSGTFADRLLMEADPLQLIEGMIIAGLAVGAEQGFIYLRSEYPRARHCLEQALDAATRTGVLGANILGSGRRFAIELRMGAGSYICGEETALLESLEGRRGMVRAKPPLPALRGLFGCPTVVNNVLTLAAASTILSAGAAAYAAHGSGRSRGTLAVQLAGNVRRGGLVEIPYGLPLRRLLSEFAGGTRSGRPMRAVQVGGPLGAYLPESLWDTPLDYEAFAAAGAMLGHGGVVIFDDSVDLLEQARFAMAFCAEESCGKCTPCRIGAVRGVELLDRLRAGEQPTRQLALLDDLCELMEAGSLCAMGGLTPLPVRSALRHFPADFAGTASSITTD
jgi:formate dehydrogenase iron-sulfur subunit